MSNSPYDPNPEELPSFQWPASSNFGKEMARWDKPKSRGGMKPDGFERFPQMLYKANPRLDNGRMATEMEEPPRYMYATDAAWINALQAAHDFTRKCQRTVQNEAEYARAREEGWCDSPKAALDKHEALQDAVADAALYRHAEDLRLRSEAAKAEAQLVDEDSFEHVPAITPEAVAVAKDHRAASLEKARAAKKAKAGAVPAA